MKKFKREEKNFGKRINSISKWTEEESRNIVGFFELLLKVDKRINPHLYKKKKPKL